MDYTELGMVAFNAYREARAGKAQDGTDIPAWANVEPDVAAAWTVAAKAIYEKIREQSSAESARSEVKLDGL